MNRCLRCDRRLPPPSLRNRVQIEGEEAALPDGYCFRHVTEAGNADCRAHRVNWRRRAFVGEETIRRLMREYGVRPSDVASAAREAEEAFPIRHSEGG